jgi:hypothetical protein
MQDIPRGGRVMSKNAAEVLASITIGRAALIGLVLADGFGLGALVIFVCWPPLFLSLDFSKLLLLSAALTLPFLALGALMYQIGAAARDYSRLHESLAQNIPFVLLNHLLYVLAALFAYAAQSTFPIGEPWVASHVFWIFSALSVTQLFFLGLHLEHQKPWMRTMLPWALGAFGICRGAYGLGKAFHWWG